MRAKPPLLYFHSTDPLIYPSGANIKNFLPDPLIYPSFLHSLDHSRLLLTTVQITKFSWGLRPQTPFAVLPQRRPPYLCFSANIKKLSGGYAPRPPDLSFLFTLDYYSLQHYYQNFWGGPCPQTPLFIPSFLHLRDL